MKKLLSLMLSLGIVISFAGCSKDDEDKKEPKEEVVVEPKEGMEEAYELFSENSEEGYEFVIEGEYEGLELEMEGYYYEDGTYEIDIEMEGAAAKLVCGVDGEYEMSTSYDDEEADEEEIKDECNYGDFSDGYEGVMDLILYLDMEDVFDLDEDEYEYNEKDGVFSTSFVLEGEDEEEEDIEYDVFIEESGEMIEISNKDIKAVFEIS